MTSETPDLGSPFLPQGISGMVWCGKCEYIKRIVTECHLAGTKILLDDEGKCVTATT